MVGASDARSGSHGRKGRNENEDLLLARAWMHALDVGSLVVAND